ncbi:MAG TPA: hypothetical protein VFI34_00160 [Candidatus Limnocylindrales bacterium]|nr:hypothetical protein [Candidatus Limnocylindrales bacterium]
MADGVGAGVAGGASVGVRLDEDVGAGLVLGAGGVLGAGDDAAGVAEHAATMTKPPRTTPRERSGRRRAVGASIWVDASGLCALGNSGLNWPL